MTHRALRTPSVTRRAPGAATMGKQASAERGPGSPDHYAGSSAPSTGTTLGRLDSDALEEVNTPMAETEQGRQLTSGYRHRTIDADHLRFFSASEADISGLGWRRLRTFIQSLPQQDLVEDLADLETTVRHAPSGGMELLRAFLSGPVRSSMSKSQMSEGSSLQLVVLLFGVLPPPNDARRHFRALITDIEDSELPAEQTARIWLDMVALGDRWDELLKGNIELTVLRNAVSACERVIGDSDILDSVEEVEGASAQPEDRQTFLRVLMGDLSTALLRQASRAANPRELRIDLLRAAALFAGVNPECKKDILESLLHRRMLDLGEIQGEPAETTSAVLSLATTFARVPRVSLGINRSGPSALIGDFLGVLGASLSSEVSLSVLCLLNIVSEYERVEGDKLAVADAKPPVVRLASYLLVLFGVSKPDVVNDDELDAVFYVASRVGMDRMPIVGTLIDQSWYGGSFLRSGIKAQQKDALLELAVAITSILQETWADYGGPSREAEKYVNAVTAESLAESPDEAVALTVVVLAEGVWGESQQVGWLEDAWSMVEQRVRWAQFVRGESAESGQFRLILHDLVLRLDRVPRDSNYEDVEAESGSKDTRNGFDGDDTLSRFLSDSGLGRDRRSSRAVR